MEEVGWTDYDLDRSLEDYRTEPSYLGLLASPPVLAALKEESKLSLYYPFAKGWRDPLVVVEGFLLATLISATGLLDSPHYTKFERPLRVFMEDIEEYIPEDDDDQ